MPSDVRQQDSSLSQVPASLADNLQVDHRRQRRILFGGGLVVTVILVAIAALVVTSMVRDYIAERYAEFSVRAALFQLEFSMREHLLRLEAIHQEATWKEQAPISPDVLAAFIANNGQLAIRGADQFNPVLAVGDIKSPPGGGGFSRYLAVAKDIGYRLGAYTTLPEAHLRGYFYSPDGRFVGITPSPKQPLPTRPDGTVDPATLVQASTLGADAQTRAARWLPPAPDVLTGKLVMRLVQACYVDDRPVLVLVSEVSVDALHARLAGGSSVGLPAIVDRQGRVLLYEGQDPHDKERLESVLRQALPPVKGALPDLVFQGSNLVFRSTLQGTDWELYRVVSWQTLIAQMGPRLAAVVGGVALAILIVWGILLLLNRRILKPGYLRAKRVFESEHLNRTMVATAPTGLALLGLRTGEVLLGNQVMRTLADALPADQPGLAERLIQRYRSSPADDAGQTELELSVKNAAGESTELLVSAARATYLDDDILLCNFVDITARKQLERSLTEATQAADAANRAKSTFLATMSHEIRTPLNAILGNLELLEHTRLQPEQGKRLRTALSSGSALLDIINDILDLSKIESGQMTIEHVSFDLAALARDVGAMFEPVAKAKHLEFACHVAPELAQRYIGDPTRLRQVMTNLVGNAIKFTQTGEVVLEVYCAEDTPGTPDGTVVIGVVDSGIGMTAEQQAQIFQAFSQADSSIARRFGGTGLGLSLCKQLVEQMGGTIECTSEPEVGSTFIVQIALEPDHAEHADLADEGTREQAELSTHDIRLLVVDDYPVNRELLHDQLALLGFASDVAQSGTDALQLASQHRYDLVLTDLNMPGMSGYALARCLRDLAPALPIIAVTAHATERERAECKAADIDDVLIKPSPLPVIDRTIRRWVKRAGPATADARRVADPGRGVLSASFRTGLRDTLQRSIESIQTALARQNLDAVSAELHSVKGAFAMIHEVEIVTLCSELEDAAKAGDASTIAARVSEIVVLADGALARRALHESTLSSQS